VNSVFLGKMLSFALSDYIVLASFFVVVLAIGMIAKSGKSRNGVDYLLDSRKVGILLFVATNVATWYGGILGVGEFTYRYGVLSWVTQGLPYYIFAIIFALFFAEKIRNAQLFTIPDKIETVYGKKTALLAAGIIFIMVNPAPYLLMTGFLFALIFNISFYWGMIISLMMVAAYLYKGGFKSTLYTDLFQFAIMFIGFIIIVVAVTGEYGGVSFLKTNLPSELLTVPKGNGMYILVWFLIALWTFVDPGFHQRSYAAKSGKVAKWGIIISVLFWALFDFLTTTTGLFSRAVLGNNVNAVISYPLLAEEVLSPGLKGLFFAALFATILSTLNSMTFIGATTYSRDFIFRVAKNKSEINIEKETRIGLLVTGIIGFALAAFFQSVVEIWYTVGSILIPGMILVVIGAYYPKLRITGKTAFVEMAVGIIGSGLWLILRNLYPDNNMFELIEPMLIGLLFALLIHFVGIKKARSNEQAFNSNNLF